jgi:anaerobic magnesium-protoporphyrin IX monomethyl ester cyclase
LKVLVLNPPYVDDFCRSARWAAKSRGRVQRHPDGLLIAVAVLEAAGHEVKFVDGAALNMKKDEVEGIARQFRPELAVLHTTTPSIYNDIDYARAIKGLTGAMTVLVGPHVSALPADTLRIDKGAIDAVARGEYDYTIREIASGANLSGVAGIDWLDGEEVRHNPDRELLDVKELPFPAWHHIKPEWYYDAGKKFPFLTLISGRGCFGKCTFCRDTQLMYGRKLRYRDPSQVVDEMEYDIKLFPELNEIMFETDTFAASRKHAQGVCEEILRRGLKISWSCNARVDIDLTLLPLMKKAGCRMLMVGFEFGTQAGLDSVKKGVTVEQSRKFAEEAARLGFVIHGCFMVGAPGETEETARETLKFARSLPLDTIQVSGICTYPGTELYDWAKKNKYVVAEDWTEWVSKDYEQVTLLSYPQLSKERIDQLIDEGLKKFYLRPRQMLRMLLNIRSAADLKRKLYGLKAFLDYFGKKGTK